MNGKVDIAGLLDNGAWTAYQKVLTALAALAVVFDGFDIQVLGFAIPSLMREWGRNRQAFGPVLAVGLAGMAAGSPLIGYCGDRFGRRPALIGCLTLFGLATLATSFVHSLLALAVLRFVTGVGTGGMLPVASALAAEFAPLRRRAAAVKLTIVCVPLGGMLGGLVAARVLPEFGWRALYQAGGLAPLAFAALLWLILPESPRFLVLHPHRWLELESMLRRMGNSAAAGSAFADTSEGKPAGRAPLGVLLSVYGRDTAGLWIAFLFCLGGIYLAFGWLPAMLTAQGVDVAGASHALALYNLGGVAGVLIWTALMSALGSRGPLLSGALAAAISALAILLVPVESRAAYPFLLSAIALNGLLANAVQTSMYALAAHVYPTSVRASGIACAAAIGRSGGIVSSLSGAKLIGMGAGAYWGTMAVCMAITCVGLAWVRGHFPRLGPTGPPVTVRRRT